MNVLRKVLNNKYFRFILVPLLIVVFGYFGAISARDYRAKQLNKELKGYTEVLASKLDAKKFESLTSTPKDNQNQDYQDLRKELIGLGKVEANISVRWVYTLVPKGEDLVFSVDSITDENHSEPGDVYDDANDDFRNAVSTVWQDGSTQFLDKYTDKWGTFVSVLTPIKDYKTGKTISVLGIDVDYAKVYSDSLRQAEYGPYIFTFFVLLIYLLVALIRPSLLRRLLVLLVLMIGFGILWSARLVPRILAIPNDFTYSAQLNSKDEFYNADQDKYDAPLLSNGRISYSVIRETDNVVTIENIFDVRLPNGNKVFSARRILGVDPVTTEHVPGFGDKTRTGTLFAPRNVNKKNFTYWQPNFDAPSLMRYKATENIDGLEVYRYEATVNADQTDFHLDTPGVPDERRVLTRAVMTAWVEPITGRFVKYHDSAIAWYIDAQTGVNIEPRNKFENVYTAESIKQQVVNAKSERSNYLLLAYVLPIGLAVLILLVFLLLSLKKKLSLPQILQYLVIMMILLGSVEVFYLAGDAFTQRTKNRFDTRVQATSDAIIGELNNHEDLLYSLRAFATSGGVDNMAAWSAKVKRLQLQQRDPDVLVAGYIDRVPAKELKSHELLLQKDRSAQPQGYPDYRVRPARSVAEYLPITYIEPYASNELAHGFDVSSESSRNAAAEYSRDNGLPTITGPITLVQDSKKLPGFLMLLAVYKDGFPIKTLQQRRDALVGYVYAGFRSKDVITDALNDSNPDRGIDLEIYDNNNVSASSLIFDGDNDPHLINGDKFPITTYRPIDVGGRVWGLYFSANKDFLGSDFGSYLQYLALIAGLLLSGLVALVFWQLRRTQDRAERIAQDMTSKLKVSESELRKGNAKLTADQLELRKRAQEASRQNEAMLNLLEDIKIKSTESAELTAKSTVLLDSATQFSIIATDLDGNITNFNKGAEIMLGYKASEMIGKQTPAIIHDSHEVEARGAELSKKYHKKIAGFDVFVENARRGRYEEREWTYIKKDGTRLKVSLVVSALKDKTGKVTGFLGIAKDVTKQSEYLAAIERFKLAVEAAYDHILITDKDGKIIYANGAAQTLTGYTYKEMEGKTPALWGQQMPKEFYAKMWDTIKNKKKVFIGEVTNKNKAGVQYQAEVHISPILDERGEVEYFLGVERDITKLKEIDRQKTEFVSLASHQLKTPVSAIGWNMEMLLSGDYGKLTEKQREPIESSYKMNKRMNELVNGFLNVSRIELGTFVIEPQSTDIKSLCDEVLDELHQKALAKGHKITKKFDKEIGKLMVDPKLMRIVFQNYISNAIKYTQPKGRIEIAIRKQNDFVQISVTNNGDPIPKVDQSKIFTKLFRASNAQEQDPDGNGLGLYLVKAIAESSGGKVWFESTKGKDTTFYITIPLAGMKKKAGSRSLT